MNDVWYQKTSNIFNIVLANVTAISSRWATLMLVISNLESSLLFLVHNICLQ